MAFTYIPIPLFNEENFQQCIVVPFPEGGEIVDTMVIDKTAYVLVETTPSARIIQGHFHIVPVLQKLYADGHKYVGTFTIKEFMGIPLGAYTVIQITSGDYGIFSQEFIDIHGEEERDRIISNHQDDIKQNFPSDEDDEELRKLWDFDMNNSGADKTEDNEDSEPESES